jgi:hypothetical protein
MSRDILPDDKVVITIINEDDPKNIIRTPITYIIKDISFDNKIISIEDENGIFKEQLIQYAPNKWKLSKTYRNKYTIQFIKTSKLGELFTNISYRDPGLNVLKTMDIEQLHEVCKFDGGLRDFCITNTRYFENLINPDELQFKPEYMEIVDFYFLLTRFYGYLNFVPNGRKLALQDDQFVADYKTFETPVVNVISYSITSGDVDLLNYINNKGLLSQFDNNSTENALLKVVSHDVYSSLKWFLDNTDHLGIIVRYVMVMDNVTMLKWILENYPDIDPQLFANSFTANSIRCIKYLASIQYYPSKASVDKFSSYKMNSNSSVMKFLKKKFSDFYELDE